jgi:hypothetical protein
MINFTTVLILKIIMKLSNRLSALALLLMAVAGTPAWAQKCAASEATLYEGTTGKKGILVCATPAKAPYSKIEYRFGPAEKAEMTYTADAASGRKFFASSEALQPRASLSHLWFTNGDTTYVITQCIGGNCPHSGGMVVAKGKKIIARIKAKEGTFTADDAVDFDGEKSKTPLIQIKYPDGIDLPKLFD